jgi:hypothetical protein
MDPTSPGKETDMSKAITIRRSTHADAAQVAELAELDGRRAPAGAALLAYVDGELRAAVGIGDGRAVADPFHLTNDVVGVLCLMAEQEREDDRGSPHRLLRLLGVDGALHREEAAA